MPGPLADKTEEQVRGAVSRLDGQPYWFGEGDAGDPLGAPSDCSGGCTKCAVATGLLHPWAQRWSTTTMEGWEVIAEADAGPGDMAVYGEGTDLTHAAFITHRDADGVLWAMNCHGGGSSTKGNDPKAKCEYTKVTYWNKLVGYRRIPAEIRDHAVTKLWRTIVWYFHKNNAAALSVLGGLGAVGKTVTALLGKLFGGAS